MNPHHSPLHFQTITEIAGLLKSKQVSPVELTKELLQRIEQHDGRVHNAEDAVLAEFEKITHALGFACSVQV